MNPSKHTWRHASCTTSQRLGPLPRPNGISMLRTAVFGCMLGQTSLTFGEPRFDGVPDARIHLASQAANGSCLISRPSQAGWVSTMLKSPTSKLLLGERSLLKASSQGLHEAGATRPGIWRRPYGGSNPYLINSCKRFCRGSTGHHCWRTIFIRQGMNSDAECLSTTRSARIEIPCGWSSYTDDARKSRCAALSMSRLLDSFVTSSEAFSGSTATRTWRTRAPSHLISLFPQTRNATTRCSRQMIDLAHPPKAMFPTISSGTLVSYREREVAQISRAKRIDQKQAEGREVFLPGCSSNSSTDRRSSRQHVLVLQGPSSRN
jgi:hypothetical protein